MPWITAESRAILASLLHEASPKQFVCPCYDTITAAIEPRGIFRSMKDYTIFDGSIVPHGDFLQTAFLPEGDGLTKECDHQHVTDVKVIVCKWDEPIMKEAEKVLIYNAKVVHQQHQTTIDARFIQTGLLDVSNMQPANLELTCGEIFAGGFSGWSHAVQAISSEVIPMRHIWAVDHDFMAVEMYTRSHPNSIHLRSGKEASEYRKDENEDKDPTCKVFQCDVRTPWFLSHVKAGEVDIIVWSPPCQPWSYAHTSQGFNKGDGLVWAHGLIAIAHIRPSIFILEEVAQFAKHDQFELVKRMISWAGYEIISIKAINLKDVIPQNRDRCIVIAIDCHSTRLNRIFEWENWPVLPSSNLRVARVITPFDEDSMQSVIPEPKVLDMYFNRNLLPKSYDEGIPRTIGKKELRSYRIRTLDDKCFACIMASYRKAHLLPEAVINRGGLYGAFIYDGHVVRFLTTAEIFMMMGGITSCILPICPDAQSHLLGNCISVPHATIAILNAIKMFPGKAIAFTTQEAFANVMARRIRADAVETIICEQGLCIRSAVETHLLIDPTLAVPLFITMTVKTPTTTFCFRVREGLKIMDVMKNLLGPSTPQDIWIIMQNGSKLPLIESDVTQDFPMMLWANIPSKLFLDDGKFQTCENPFVIILSHNGIVVQKRIMGHLIYQVGNTVREFFPDEFSGSEKFVDPFGRAHDRQIECPDCVFCQPSPEGNDQNMQMLNLPKFVQCHDILKTQCSWTVAMKVVQFVKQSGMMHALQCVGWTIYIQPINGKGDNTVDVILAPSMNGLSLSTQHMQMYIISWMFIKQLPTPKHDGNDLVHVCFKLWDSWVWDGNVESGDEIGIFMHPWKSISEFIGHTSELRIVVQGKNFMPEVKFHQLPKSRDSLRLNAILSLCGGGNKADAMIETKNHIAVFMLNQGADLMGTTTMIDAMSRACGLQTMKTIVQIQKDSERMDAIKKLASTMHIEFPNITNKEVVAQQKTKDWAKQKQMQAQQKICANELELLPSVFRNEDDTMPSVKTSISPGMSGIVLTDAEVAAPWIVDPTIISSDECAVVVLGHKCPARDSKHCCKAQIPVKASNGQTLIIAACVHNLGQKRIRIHHDDKIDQVVVKEGTVMAFTLFRDEIPAHEWAQAASHPVKYALQAMNVEESSFQGPPWGRSWLAHGMKCAPHDATSVQFHARVEVGKVENYLRLSGTNGIYTIPKTKENMADAKYAIVWVDKSPIEISQMLVQAPEHLGQIRITKTKGSSNRTSRGVRCRHEEFKSLFAKLRPQDDIPDITPISHIYKVQPVPVGAKYDDIQKWMKANSWNGRPVKSLNEKSWLVG